MVMITLYVRQQQQQQQQKKETHRYIEQTLELCGRGRGWDDLGEWH